MPPQPPPQVRPFQRRRVLQWYLEDKRCTDDVYLALISSALAEHHSEGAVIKCVALLKQFVHRCGSHRCRCRYGGDVQLAPSAFK